MKLLIVEDNKTIANMLKNFFDLEKWDSIIFHEGYEALENFYSIKPDLVILDWMLPTISGIELCKELKRVNPSIPIIILTAKSNDLDEIIGFNNGADEYIRKPFNPKILILRIKSLLNRKKEIQIKINNNVIIKTCVKEIFKNNILITLSPKEYELLLYLSENKNQYFSREQLIEYIWGFDFDGDIRTIDTHIANLRKKLELKNIKNKRGIGYSLVIEK
ncbi:response regulator transcription factor [Candidatus Cetobacterium colombiensis]|uniref:Response regulator transcription factor n=1 Tax=Candidatus Cetobacterium colombiensis TaxID=3073100 RepID=A0ABU4W9D5_9FUSO|nr:response regulator transcription factor [Candidatus Cetobacterium colombiensis]MDX8335662.1 response regulator transcription factor [Candidatus Cetobacterium colombiensis]